MTPQRPPGPVAGSQCITTPAEPSEALREAYSAASGGDGMGCEDCGLPYGGPGWVDAVVTPDDWAQVSPTGDENGILCPHCMGARFEALGRTDVPVALRSGPWALQELAGIECPYDGCTATFPSANQVDRHIEVAGHRRDSLGRVVYVEEHWQPCPHCVAGYAGDDHRSPCSECEGKGVVEGVALRATGE